MTRKPFGRLMSRSDSVSLMAQSEAYDLHDETLIHAHRFSARYGVAPSSTSLAGHSVRTFSVAWNSIGDILASSADDGSVHLWSLQDCRRIAQTGFTKHSTVVNSVRWSPIDSHTLATTSADQGVLLWDHRDGGTSPTAIFGKPNTFGDPTWFDFSPDGKQVALVEQISRYTSRLTIYDTRQNLPLEHTVIVPFPASTLNWIHSSDIIALGTSTGNLWCVGAHVVSESPFTSIVPAHNATVLTTHSVRDVLVSGGSDSMVQVWDASSLACLASFSHADNSVRCVSVSPDSQVVASAYEKDIALHTTTGHFLGSINASIWAVSWHPWRCIVAYGGESHSKKEGGRYTGSLGLTNYEIEAK